MTANGFKYIIPVTLAGRTPDCNGEPCVFFGNWKYHLQTNPETNSLFVDIDNKIYPVMERENIGLIQLYIEVEENPFSPMPTLTSMMAEMEKFLEHPERYVLKTDIEPLLK